MREVSTMETEGQEPTTMDKEAKEATVPSSRMAADEPVIPTNLEHQVGTTGVTVVPEMDAPMMEKEKSTEPPPIETRTVETQEGNYVTIDTRILEQWGRLEVADRSPAEPTQGAMQPKPALGPAEIPGLVEVELVRMAQATTSQAAPPPQQKTKGRLEVNGVATRRLREEDKERASWKAAQKERTKREAKEENDDPSFSAGQKD